MANANIHTGFWTDHSRGSFLRGTITLEAKYGGQLVSAAAIVVQIIGVAVWTITAFFIHQRRAKPGLRDEYEAQSQVLLRNTAGAESATTNFLQLGWAWRGHKRGALRKAIASAMIPALIYASFVLAGVFVNQIATSSWDNPTVLIQQGNNCGFIDSNGDDPQSLSGLAHVGINVSIAALQYARSCYAGRGSISAISCSVYPKSTLSYNVSNSQPCPVPGSSVCYGGANGQSILLTTAALDSHHDLGINAAEEDRLTIQYQTTCAPLDYDFVDHYISLENLTSEWWPYGNTTVEHYDMGNITEGNTTTYSTYQYSPTIRFWGIGTTSYFLNSFQSLYPHTGEYDGWAPVTPFNATRGDLTVFFLAPNGVTFSGPVQDPMFQTLDEPSQDIFGDAPYVTKRTNYLLACVEQWQICNTAKDNTCTGWVTQSAFIQPNSQDEFAAALGLNQAQNATLVRISKLPLQANMQAATRGVPDPLLASTYTSSNTGSQPLPNDFWRTEVEGWFQAVLAKIQLLESVFVNIPGDIVNANDIAIIPATTISQELGKQCAQQRITAPQQYQSYNLFALILIALVGIVVVGLAIVLRLGHEHLPGAKKHVYRLLSYEAEGLLSLHRMALEGAGFTGWIVGKAGTPVVEQASPRLPQADALDSGEPRNEVVDEHARAKGLIRYPGRKEVDGEHISTCVGDAEPEDVELLTSKPGYRQLARENGP